MEDKSKVFYVDFSGQEVVAYGDFISMSNLYATLKQVSALVKSVILTDETGKIYGQFNSEVK